MDYKLHRPQSACSRTGRSFAAGEEFFSVIIRGAEGLGRIDVAAEAWEGPPEETVAWWRARLPVATDKSPQLAPVDVLLDALEALEESPNDDPLRYLLALQLVRRRALRLEGKADEAADADASMVFSCRRRGRDYLLRPVQPEEMADPELATRLN